MSEFTVMSEYQVGDKVAYTDEALKELKQADTELHTVVKVTALPPDERGDVDDVYIVLDHCDHPMNPSWVTPAEVIEPTHVVVTVGTDAEMGAAFMESEEAAKGFAEGWQAGKAGGAWVLPIRRKVRRLPRTRVVKQVIIEEGDAL